MILSGEPGADFEVGLRARRSTVLRNIRLAAPRGNTARPNVRGNHYCPSPKISLRNQRQYQSNQRSPHSLIPHPEERKWWYFSKCTMRTPSLNSPVLAAGLASFGSEKLWTKLPS